MVVPANDFGCLADAIREARGTGWVWLAIVERLSDSDADAIGQVLNVVELGVPVCVWASLDRGDAAETMARFLRQPIPFAVELMPVLRSTEVAAAFLEAFSANARFVSNLADPPYAMSGWSPVTAHTFDSFVIALDDRLVGVIGVADED